MFETADNFCSPACFMKIFAFTNYNYSILEQKKSEAMQNMQEACVSTGPSSQIFTQRYVH